MKCGRLECVQILPLFIYLIPDLRTPRSFSFSSLIMRKRGWPAITVLTCGIATHNHLRASLVPIIRAKEETST